MSSTLARTAPSVGNFTQVYRISEYQFLPDFLDNHDSADADAIPVYIMDHNPITTASISPHWDQCAAALPKGPQHLRPVGCFAALTFRLLDQHGDDELPPVCLAFKDVVQHQTCATTQDRGCKGGGGRGSGPRQCAQPLTRPRI